MPFAYAYLQYCDGEPQLGRVVAMKRPYVNAIGGAISFIGLIGGPIRAVLEALGVVQTVQWLDAMLDPKILAGFNWQVPYTYAFVFGVAFLGAANFDLLKRIYTRRRARRFRDWNITAYRCIQYLREESLISLNFPREEDLRKTAMEIFAGAAREGKLAVAGASPSSGVPMRIPERRLKDAIIEYDDEIKGYIFRGPSGDRYVGLLVNEFEVRQIWPTRR